MRKRVKKITICRVLCFFIIFSIGLEFSENTLVFANEHIKINKDNVVVDINLKKKLNSEIFHSKNLIDPISEKQMSEITEDQWEKCNFENSNIENLEGIQYINKNIVNFNFSKNTIKDINVFKDFKKINKLNLDENNIKNINVLNGIEIKKLTVKNQKVELNPIQSKSKGMAEVAVVDVKDINGKKLEPTNISNGGVFNSKIQKIIWNDIDKNSNEQYRFENTEKTFSVYVNQRIDVTNDVQKNLSSDSTNSEEVNIPDQNLKHALNEELKQEKDAVISKAQLNCLKKVYLKNKGITNLEGLQYCTNLEMLELEYNEISDISVLKDLSNLEALELRYNKISDISSLKDLVKLSWGDIRDQKISGKDVTSVGNTVRIKNEIKGLNKEPISIKKSSEYFYDKDKNEVVFNNITENCKKEFAFEQMEKIGGLSVPFSGRVISDVLYSPEINIPDQNLKHALNEELKQEKDAVISKAQLASLSKLYLENRGIENLEGLQYCTNLKELDLRHNKISDISSLKDLVKLSWVNLRNQYISGKEVTSVGNTVRIKNEIKGLNKEPISIKKSPDYSYDKENKEVIFKNITENCNKAFYFETDLKIGQDNNVMFTGTVASNVLYNPEINILDQNLKQVLNEQLKQQSGEIIYKEQLESLTTLDLNTKGIANIEGLQYCTNLIDLNLGVNKIKDISLLKDLINLKILRLQQNQISDIGALKGLTKLEVINLDSNQISDINELKGLIHLYDLGIASNKIKDISALKDLINLKVLRLEQNQISDIGALKGLTKLEVINLDSNQISDINELKDLTKLTDLRLSDQNISGKEVTSVGNIVRIKNEIKGLNKEPISINSSSDYSYDKENNEVIFKNITENCNKAFSFETKLTIGQATNVMFNGKVTSDVLYNPEINIPNQNLKHALNANLNQEKDAIIYKSQLEGITKLMLWANNIENIEGLQYCTNLIDLNVGHNGIKDISALKGLTNLESLNVGYNKIKDISLLKDLPNLKMLGVYNNQIKDISPLKDLTKLTELRLSNNQIENITALNGLTNLTSLKLDGNQIKDISALKGLTKLTELWLSNNQIENITALNGLTNLPIISLNNNQIKDVSALKDLTKLTELHLSNNQIKDISSLKGLTNLKGLHLRYNKISDISPLEKLTNVRKLELGGNEISDISALNGLHNVDYLDLEENQQISDIRSLKDLTNLNKLYLKNNQIKDISPLKDLTNLISLSLDNNKISDISLLKDLKNISWLELKNQNISGKEVTSVGNIVRIKNELKGLNKETISINSSSDYSYDKENNEVIFKNITENCNKAFSFETKLTIGQATNVMFNGKVTSNVLYENIQKYISIPKSISLKNNDEAFSKESINIELKSDKDIGNECINVAFDDLNLTYKDDSVKVDALVENNNQIINDQVYKLDKNNKNLKVNFKLNTGNMYYSNIYKGKWIFKFSNG